MTHQAVKYAGIGSTHELGLWTRFITLLRNLVKTYIPEGYQDEKGFHLGVEHRE